MTVDVMHIARFERFFRRSAGLDVDKEDLRRLGDFIHTKTCDLMLRAEANAKANERDLIRPFDLPITKGLQESIHAYRRIREDLEREDLEIEQCFRDLVSLPRLDLICSDEVVVRLPEIIGGLSYALARTFKIVSPELKNPQTRDWEMAFELFGLLL
jgi:hypothetical protein